jgi:hypothetical protein
MEDKNIDELDKVIVYHWKFKSQWIYQKSMNLPSDVK